MSGNTWVIADPHFNHRNVLTFKRHDGEPLRPFETVEEMNETMIKNWNDVVHEQDRVYLLGDVAFHRRDLRAIIPRLKGRIILVKGNHDTEKLSVYQELFEDVRAYVPKKGFVLSHIPLHPACLERWGVNIHGHLHANRIKMHESGMRKMSSDDSTFDPRYKCVSVEHIDYTPILLSKALEL